jgi:hypothetical protein
MRSVLGSKSSSEFFVQFMGPNPSSAQRRACSRHALGSPGNLTLRSQVPPRLTSIMVQLDRLPRQSFGSAPHNNERDASH